MKFLSVCLLILLTACSESDMEKCVSAFGDSLGTLTAHEISEYEDKGCCYYQGGVSKYYSCDGSIVCNDGSAISSCSRD